MVDTFGNFSQVDIGPDSDELKLSRERLIREDAALRPWLVGKALRDCPYTWWDRVKLLFAETSAAARLSWRMSR